MGARHKLNDIHLGGIAVLAAAAGLAFASLDVAILLGVLLLASSVAAGEVRFGPTDAVQEARRDRPRRRSRRR